MCKVIQFPSKDKRETNYTYEDYINVVEKINNLEEDIETDIMYNDYYREYNGEEYYNKVNQQIELKKAELSRIKELLVEIKEVI